MRFQWDGKKSPANREKRGIDLETAKSLRLDKGRVEIEMAFPDEKRWALIAKAQGKTLTAIYTMRDEVIRLISVRRSRTKEVRLHEEEGAGRRSG